MEWRSSARIFTGPLGPWLRLMRFDRPIGLWLLLWPTWWGLLMAGGGRPGLANLLIFTAGVVLMRSAGCVINDVADRHFDPRVARTAGRPIAAGEVAPRQALGLFLGLLAAAFGLVLLTNALTVLLAVVGGLVAVIYPFLKRFFDLPQAMLGVAFGWAIPMAFAAETGTLPEPAWWMFSITVIWVLMYDTLYAMADRSEDLRIGVRSSAILFGRFDLAIIALLMGLMIAGLVLFGLRYLPEPPWFVAVALVFGLFQRQLWWIRGRDPAACFRAFVSNHQIGLVLCLGLAAALWLR